MCVRESCQRFFSLPGQQNRPALAETTGLALEADLVTHPKTQGAPHENRLPENIAFYGQKRAQWLSPVSGCQSRL
jgi:hypothetical protein